IYWGAAGAPAAGTGFDALSTAQKKIVAAALGYDSYEGNTWFNAGAAPNARLVTEFASAGAADFDIDSIDWGGVRAPATGATFEQLTVAQRAIVADSLGYAQVATEVLVKPSAAVGKQIVLTLEQGAGKDYDNSTLDWGTVAKAAASTAFADLTLAQQDRVLSVLGYARFDGVVYHDADAAAAQQYRLGFTAGTDYNNATVTWSDVPIPVAGTDFAHLTAEQKFRVLDQTGFVAYDSTVYFKAGAGADALKQTFVEGVDYHNASMSWGSVAPQQSTRWVVTDGTAEYMVYAYDADGNGSTDEVRILEPHYLLGQRGFGALVTGTVTTLQANADFSLTGAGDAIIRGRFDLAAPGSDLLIQSDSWVYWEAAANVNGNISLLGGVAVDGTNLGGANSHGTSLYIHETSAVSTTAAGSTIRLAGALDVELRGTTIAGASIGEHGITWQGADASINVTAGQQILVDTALAASKSVSLTTTGVVSGDDNGYSIIIGSAAGLNAGGITSDSSGGAVNVNAAGNVSIGGRVLAGGVMVQQFNGGALVGESVDWSGKNSSVSLVAAGQMYLGAMALTEDGGLAEVGATVRANASITVRGGHSADGVGVKMPGAARLITNNADGLVSISAAQDAEINGLVVAGGEVTDHYDSRGKYLGSTTSSFGGASRIRVTADNQVRLGHDLSAGAEITVRGGQGSAAPSTDPWADQGIVVGGNVHLKTLQENSVLTLSSSGDMSVLAPAWTNEIVADDFAQFADGDLSADTAFRVTIDLGTHTLSGVITLSKLSSLNNHGLGDLKTDLQAALDAAQLSVTASPSGTPAVGDSATLGGVMNARLVDGHLMLTSDFAFSLAAVADGHAERLGLTQLDATNPSAGATVSSRSVALDASARGSVVNLGMADAPSGQITISGWVRGHSGINMFAGTSSGGNQDVDLTITGVLETLSGSMVLNPTGHALIEGSLIARGRNADIIINARDSLDVVGNLTAQRDIIINAGSRQLTGETSLSTTNSAHFNTLDSTGRIILTGLNDVLINNNIGGDSTVGLIQIGSSYGTVTTAINTVLQTGTLMTISGNKLDIGGTLRSSLATDATYDREITLTAATDIVFHADLRAAGSVLLNAAGDIDLYHGNLLAQGAGQRIELSAGDAIQIGHGGASTGFFVAANGGIDATAGGKLALAIDGQLSSSGAASHVALTATNVAVDGLVKAGALLDLNSGAYSWSGKNASLAIRATQDMLLGSVAGGGKLESTGLLRVQSGSNGIGLGFSMTAASTLKVDATGAGTWTEVAAGADGQIELLAEGDIQLRGLVSAADSGADIRVLSRSQVWIDGLVSANDSIHITGGTHATGVAVLVNTLIVGVNASTGGTLDTAAGGHIIVDATDSILIEGVIGQQDLGQAKVGSLSISSSGRDVTVLRNIDVAGSVTLAAGNISVLSGAYVHASGVNSDVFMQARSKLLVSGANTLADPDIPMALIMADRLVHLAAPTMEVNGFVQAGIDANSAHGRLLLSGGSSITIGGVLKSNDAIDIHSGVNLRLSREFLEGDHATDSLTGGTVKITGQAVVNALGAIVVQAGGDVTIAADSAVAAPTSIQVPVYTTVSEAVSVVTGYTQVQDGVMQVAVQVPVTTSITEQTGTVSVKVGSEYNTFDARLTQTGYYNPNAAYGKQFRETLVEGVDYTNNDARIKWSDFGVSAPDTNYKSAGYKTFQDLSDNQKKAVLAGTGYLALFDFDYSNAQLHRTENGTPTIVDITTDPTYKPTWANNAKVIYHIDVDGWRDKYVLMQSGAQEDILNINSFGTARYLSGDATLDGSSNGTWSAFKGGELVGKYTDSANVVYTQDKSVFNNPSNGYDYDQSTGRWAVTYEYDTGTRNYQIYQHNTTTDTGALAATTIARQPDWYWAGGGTGTASLSGTQGSRATSNIAANNAFITALQSDTGALNFLSSSTRYNQLVGWAEGGGYVIAYEHTGGGGWTNTFTNSSSWVGSGPNDEYSSFYLSGGTDHITIYWDINYGGGSWTIYGSVGSLGDWNDETSSLKVFGKRYEDYHDYRYDWDSNSKNIYDERIQLDYHVTTLATDKFNYQPVYKTSTVTTMATQMQDVTLWKTVPVLTTQNVLHTTVTMVDAAGQAYGEFAGETISGGAISIDAGGTLKVSGKLAAKGDLDLSAGAVLQLKGNVVNTVTVNATLEGHDISLDAGTRLLLDGSAAVHGTGSGATVSLHSDQDISFGGAISAKAGASIASVSLDADRNVSLSGAISAAGIAILAGQGGSGDGAISADAKTSLSASAGNISLTTGSFGGAITLDHSALSASATVSLSAASSHIDQSAGLIHATAIVASAESGISLVTTVADATLSLSGAGNASLTNTGDLRVLGADVADGAVTIATSGDLHVLTAQAHGSSDRNNITFSTNLAGGNGADMQLGAISAGSRGTLSLTAQGAIGMDGAGTSLLRAANLLVDVQGALTLSTDVGALSVASAPAVQGQRASVAITQGATSLTLTSVSVASGAFSLAAAGSVDVANLRILSN
ncbi:MAG: peptidase inhibitor family I36 protein, partial [Massilia sp.]